MSRNKNNRDILTTKTEMEQAVDELKEKVETAEIGVLEKATEPLMTELVSGETTAVKTETPILGVVVNCDNLRVRKESSTDSTVITTLPKKTVVKILSDATPGWYYIQETETKGFVMSKFIEIQ